MLEIDVLSMYTALLIANMLRKLVWTMNRKKKKKRCYLKWAMKTT